MLDPVDAVVAVVALAAAGFVIGAIGFGFGLTTSPALLLFFEPQTVVVVVNAVAIAAFGLVLAESRRIVAYRNLAPTAAAGALGAPVGVFALSEFDPGALRVGISALALGVTALVALKSEWRVPKPHIAGPALGAGVGALVTGAAIGGPLLALFFIGRGMGRESMRASMAFFFMAMSCAAAVGYAALGLFTPERLLLIALAAPASAGGYCLSRRVAGGMSPSVFRRAVVGFIVATSLLALLSELLPNLTNSPA